MGTSDFRLLTSDKIHIPTKITVEPTNSVKSAQP